MRVALKYGDGHLMVDLPDTGINVIEPVYTAGLSDERDAFIKAVRAPLGSLPLREMISAEESVAIVIPDITRPFPGNRAISWLMEEMGHVSPDRITIIIGTGSHRACTPEEMTTMLGREIISRYHVVNHDAFKPDKLDSAGQLRGGRRIRMNREYIRADKRILLGFVEPHFMAGFSGGYKAVCPGILGIEDIIYFHGAEMIDHSCSTWGVLDGNPTQNMIRECGALQPADLCINVTLNRDRHITGLFAGEPIACHEEACRFCRESAMLSVPDCYDIVITTNGGYPLDQNLYQTVKGMSAASRIVRSGGLILCAAECRDGFPDHGNFKSLLTTHSSPEDLLAQVRVSKEGILDQWEAQLLAIIASRARIALYSGLAAYEVSQAYMEAVENIELRLAAELDKLGGSASIAVLPEGPMTIPYIKEEN
ncbi:MAG: nickel-dependent lactate racemase [bacterium]|nr:nickel-dependent lactate racemase [bacterium]